MSKLIVSHKPRLNNSPHSSYSCSYLGTCTYPQVRSLNEGPFGFLPTVFACYHRSMPILYPRRPCQWWLSKPWPQTLHKQLLTTSTGVVPGHHHHHHHRRMEIPCMTWSRRGWEGRSVGVGVEEGWHAGTRTPQLPDAKQLSMVRVGWG